MKSRQNDAATTAKFIILSGEAEGSAVAQFDLGQRYLKGDSVEKSLPEALKWLGLSAAQGHKPAVELIEKLRSQVAEP